MAKRDRRRSGSSKSKVRPTKTISAAARAKAVASDPDHRKKHPNPASVPALKTHVRTPPQAASRIGNLLGAGSSGELDRASLDAARRRRSRTPLPSLIPGELEEIHLGGGKKRRNRRAATFEEKIGRFQHIQEFSHNPNLFDLRGGVLDTSSRPQEIEARIGEVRYQIDVIQSLLTVLTEELDTLERAQAQVSANQSRITQS